MTDHPIELDARRGMAAQKATDIRRVLADVEANAALLRARQADLEVQMLAEPASSWPDAAAKARYVLNLYLATLGTQDSRHRNLVTAVLADFHNLSDKNIAATSQPEGLS